MPGSLMHKEPFHWAKDHAAETFGRGESHHGSNEEGSSRLGTHPSPDRQTRMTLVVFRCVRRVAPSKVMGDQTNDSRVVKTLSGCID